MEFIKPMLKNADEIRKYLENNEYRSCDFCVGTLVLWGDYFHYRYAVVNDTFVIGQEKNGEIAAVTFPVGEENNIYDAVEMLMKFFSDKGKNACFMNVTKDIEAKLNEWYPGKFKIIYDRNNADYIYLAEKLSTFSGRKLHSKKNHCNHFIEEFPDYTFEPITDENKKYCLRLEDRWNSDIDESKNVNEEQKLENEADYEERAISYALDHMKELGLTGGVLMAREKAVAFTIGEPLTKDTYVVHFEKAVESVQGAYPMICREYVSKVIEPQGYIYVNREEDLGVDGLRMSKMSYQPEMLYEKGISVIDEK